MKTLIATAILSLAAVCAAQAAPVLYQATLTDTFGTPSRNEQVTLRLSLTGTDGTVLYSESHTAVTDGSGRIEALVGTGTAAEGSFSDEVWDASGKMSVTLVRADGSEMTDVTDLGYTPATLHADTADGLVSANDGNGRYSLTVDDNGKISTTYGSIKFIPIPEGYTRMVFHDEFDVDGLPNPDYWSYEVGNVRNGEDQYYTDARIENINIYDGIAHFIVRKDEEYLRSIGETEKLYTSASIHTRDKVKYTYGRIDVRAKLASVRGAWPAIWLMPNDDHYGFWPRSGEIDIMEQVAFDPYVVHFTAHTSKYNGGAPANKHHYSVRIPDCPTEFHVYSLVWTEDKLQWLVDDKVRYTFKKNSPNWLDWPYDRDFYIILNLAWGGGWGGQQGLDADSLPETYEVDYVRVFQ